MPRTGTRKGDAPVVAEKDAGRRRRRRRPRASRRDAGRSVPRNQGPLGRAEGRGYDGDVRADGGVGRLADDNVSYETESGGSARGVGGSSRLRK